MLLFKSPYDILAKRAITYTQATTLSGTLLVSTKIITVRNMHVNENEIKTQINAAYFYRPRKVFNYDFFHRYDIK